MNYQEMLRGRIAAAPRKSIEEGTLKLLLSEVQRVEFDKNRAAKPLTEGEFLGIVTEMVGSNDEMLRYLPATDERAERLKIENVLLRDFVPQYLSEAEIERHLEPHFEAIKAMPKDGVAVGKALGILKQAGLDVQGGTVKTVVERIRSAVTSI